MLIEWYRQLVLHELAHFIADTLYPNCRPHGREFKWACYKIGCLGDTATNPHFEDDKAPHYNAVFLVQKVIPHGTLVTYSDDDGDVINGRFEVTETGHSIKSV